MVSHQNFIQTPPIPLDSTSWLIRDRDNNIYFLNTKGEVIYGLSLFSRDYPNLTINNIAISSDNSQIITSDNIGHLYLWNFQGDLVTHTDIKQHQEPITSLAFSQDDHYFITGSLDTTIKLWQIQTEELIPIDTFNAHKKIYRLCIFCY